MKLNRTLAVFFGAALWASAQLPDFTPPTPLIGAAMRNDTQEVVRLLESGADPNEGRFFGGGTPIFYALMQRNRAMAEAMIAKGADVRATDAAGDTTLMWAAYDEAADSSLVEKLIALGVDPAAKNKNGETALTWALRRGYTPVVEVLKKAGVSDSQMIQQSVEKAVALLQKSSPEFVKVSGCVSCHHQSLPLIASVAAERRGYTVDAAKAAYPVKATIAMYKPAIPIMAAGKPAIPDPAIVISYALISLAETGYAPDETTEAMAHLVSLQQAADGSFIALTARPPIESSTFTSTALSLRALQVYGNEPAEQVQRAREWLAAATPQTTEDRIMQLLGLTWSDAAPELVRNAARSVLTQQRQDGGWGQLPGLESDAYATGQAMVALKLSGSVKSSDVSWQRAAAFLLRTQLEDGSWLVRSRSFPVQPYKESGFPHAKNQWISASGTSWAAWALSLADAPQVTASNARP
jgi:hypothetical protein